MNKVPIKKLLRAYKEIAIMADKLDLPEAVANRAKDLFMRVKDIDGRRFLNGHSNNTIGTACLYVSCWMEEEDVEARTSKEIWSAGKHSRTEKEMSACAKLIIEKLNVPLVKTTANHFIPRFCSSLRLEKSVENIASSIARNAIELGFVSTGRAHTAIAAAAIYMASQVTETKKMRQEVAKVAGVADETVKTIYKLVRPHVYQVFPPICYKSLLDLPEM